MRFYRLFVILLLVLFCIGTVHAASMGVAMQLSDVQDAAVMHCHDTSGDDDGHDHAKPHHGNFCTSCAACVPMLTGASRVLPAFDSIPAHNPHREASYASFIGKLPHRPPISA